MTWVESSLSPTMGRLPSATRAGRREFELARPFRFAPPEHAGDLVVRARVQEALNGRFDRRVTVLSAGAGFGKTSALVQAFEESRLRRLGQDHWLACEPRDADVLHAIAGLSAGLGIEPVSQPDDFVRAVVELFSAGAPSRQCLVLDDVHHVPAGSPTAELLAELVARLPANTSIVMAGRSRPPVPLRRLELTGECVVIDESMLSLAADEILQVARRSPAFDGDTGALAGLAGWPALIRLTLAHDEPEAFIWEEVLDLLDDEQVALLRMLLTLGECRAETLAAAAGVASAEPLDRVPLVHRRGAHYGAHDLWSTLLHDDGGEAGRRRSAMAVLLADNDSAAAVNVGLDAGEGLDLDAELLQALRRALLVTAIPGARVLRRWHRQLPTRLTDAAPVLLLRGLLERIDNPGSEQCHALLQAAADKFLAVNDPPAAVAALGALAFAQHVRRDAGALIATFGNLNTLADGGEMSARPFQLLGQALVATAQSRPGEVVDHTDVLLDQPLSVDVRAIALWMRANALNNLGRDATEPAAECYEIGLPLPGISFIHYGARWRAGLIADLKANPVEPMDGDRDNFLLATWNTVLHSSLVDLDAARHWLAVVESSGSDQSKWQTAGSVRLPQASVAMAEGDVEGARAILEQMLEEHPVEGQAVGYYLAAIALYYPLFPDMRPWFDQQEGLGRLYQRDLELNQALTAVLEADDPVQLGLVRFPDQVGEFIPALGLRNTALLLAAALDAERDDVEEVIADVVELVGEAARGEFRSAASSEVPSIAAGARSILESIPVRPPQRVRVSVLGDSALALGGVPVESADWRRERVRALLGYLVLHRSTTREQAIAALWPDVDTPAGRRSLRSTLNVLNQVLEPDRVGGDAPFFVRSFGQRLQLVVDDHLEVDVEQFESLADEAERLEAAGTPSLSIDPYRRAAAAYRGDLLPGHYDDWVVFARDRLRARFVRLSVRCAELLVATGRAAEALDVIAPVLTAEPWAEPAHRVLISAYVELDDLTAARRALATCHAVLDDIGGPAEEATQELEHRLTRLS